MRRKSERLTAILAEAFESGDEHRISTALKEAIGDSDTSDLDAILAALNELGLQLTVKPSPEAER